MASSRRNGISLKEFEAFGQCPTFNGTFYKRKDSVPTKALEAELNKCKDQLEQMEVQVIAAEAEVTSIGFQKVALEHELTQYKERVKQLTDKLNAQTSAIEKSNTNKQETYTKLGVLKRGLTKQLEELRSSEREMRQAFETIKRYVNQFKNKDIKKECFISEVEHLFDNIQSRHSTISDHNSAPSFHEKGQETFQDTNLSPLKEELHEQTPESQSDTKLEGSEGSFDKRLSSMSPPPVPLWTLSADSSQHISKKPLPQPRKKIPSPHQPHLPSTFPSMPVVVQKSAEKVATGKQNRLSRAVSRVDSLYLLARPPGTQVLTQPSQFSLFQFGHGMQDNPTCSDSDSSDFELFTPQRRRMRHSSEPYLKLFQNSNFLSPQKEVRRGSSPSPVAHMHNNTRPFVGLQKQELEDVEELIRRSSFPTRKRSHCSFKKGDNNNTGEVGLSSVKLRQTTRSYSLDDLLDGQEPIPKGNGQTISDSVDSLRDCLDYSKPLQHISWRQKALGLNAINRADFSSMPNIQASTEGQALSDHNDSEGSDSEGIYINPDEVPARASPKSSHKRSVKGDSGIYLPISDITKTKKGVDIIDHEQTTESVYLELVPVSHTSNSQKKTHLHNMQSRDTLGSGYMSDLSSVADQSGNEEAENSGNQKSDSISYAVAQDTNNEQKRRKLSSSSEDLDGIYEQIDLPANAKGSGFNNSFLKVKPSPLLNQLPSSKSPDPSYSLSDNGWLDEEDGYASVGEIQSFSPAFNLAPSLPPRPQRISLDTVYSGLQAYSTVNSSLLTNSSIPANSRTRRVTHSTCTTNLATYFNGQSDSRKQSHHKTLPSETKSYNKSPLAVPRRSHTLNFPGDIKLLPSSNSHSIEKSGWLERLNVKKDKKPKRKWFELKGANLEYYNSPSKGTRTKKPQFVINLDKWCKLMTTDKKTEFHLATVDREYILTASSQKECEEWLKVIEGAMKRFISGENDGKVSMSSFSGCWIYIGNRYLKNWCSLKGRILYLSVGSAAKPYRHIDLSQCSVKVTTDSTFTESLDMVQMSDFMDRRDRDDKVLSICNNSTTEIMNIQPVNKKDKEDLYDLLNHVCNDEEPELTPTEKVLSQIMREDPQSSRDHHSWKHPVLKFSTVPLQTSLLSLPLASLKPRAKSISQELMEFMNTPMEEATIDHHIALAQNIIGQGLTHPYLQNEIYCQLLRQLSGRINQTVFHVLQGWLLLFLLIPMYLPIRKTVSWYLKVFLDRCEEDQVLCDLARNCSEKVKLSETNGPRQCNPTYFELDGVMRKQICSPQSPPSGLITVSVYLPDKTSYDIEINSCTTVAEFTSLLTNKVGLPASATTGFALMCDWPGVEDILCCPFPDSKLCDVISMWFISLEELMPEASANNPSQRISLFYRKRLCFNERRGNLSHYERVLVAHQMSENILTGIHPVFSLQEAINLTAIMAQLEYGDWKSLEQEREITREALERFCPRNYTQHALEHKWQQLQSELTTKWKQLDGRNRDECAQIYLESVYLWNFCESSLFRAQEPRNGKQPHRSLWLAINQDGVSLLDQHTMEELKSYHYSEISTFGGDSEGHFILMVSPQTSPVDGDDMVTRGEKIMLSMPKIQICEATFLIATYLECAKTRLVT